MSPAQIRVLVVDDKPGMLADAKREIEDSFAGDDRLEVQVTTEVDFDSGLVSIRRGDFDIVVLDVKRDRSDGNEPEDLAGRRVFEEVKKVRFLPVIFWTAVPSAVSDFEMPPLVTVFQKEHLPQVPDAIRDAVESQAMEVMREIEHDVASVMRTHLWEELAPHWAEDTAGGDSTDLATILITRVAQSLLDQDLPALTKPNNCYLYPPVSAKYHPGDILVNGAGGTAEWSVILTPACDLEQDKAERILLARAQPLEDLPQYRAWAASRSGNAWGKLQMVLSGKQLRHLFLPAFREIPDLVIDLENVRSIPTSELPTIRRVASLVSPHAEALLVRHSQFRGRIGTPDLDSQLLKDRLTAALTTLPADSSPGPAAA
jgi:CheY-like chemotaxis protein